MTLILAIAGAISATAEAAFEALFHDLYKPVLSFFTKKGCSPEEGEELTQETFFRAYRSYETFRGEAKPSTWLFTIATNIWLNRIRSGDTAKRTGDEVPLPDDDQAPPSPDDRPLDDAIAAERQRLLQAAIEELPSRMRQCVRFRVQQDMAYREIAEILDVNIATVKSQVSRAKEQLRRALGEHYPELESEPESGESQ